MTQTAYSVSASSAHVKTSERTFGQTGDTVSLTRCSVIKIETYAPQIPQPPRKHSSISDLVAEWEGDESSRARLDEGRRWVADAFYGNDGETVRALRLKRAWSQTRLAQELRTSQSHVARIERGTENLTIETCRKLCRALEIDLNTLDIALRRQEDIAQGGRI